MNFLIGASGRLGQALTSFLPGASTIALPRPVYERWGDVGAAAHVSRFFEPFAGAPLCIFVAAGIIDPKRPVGEHLQVNVMLPQNIVEGAGRQGARIVTFGTIMEEIVERTTVNPYFKSKLKLGDFIQEASDRNADALHIRLHTLYGGGPPDQFMFLGQLHDALRSQGLFRMSAGSQLREYHHVDDDVKAISVLARSNVTGSINLSHGDPVRLRDLATYICDRFGSLDRLEIGALTSSDMENHDRTFHRPELLKELNFRDTMSSVFDYMKSHVVVT